MCSASLATLLADLLAAPHLLCQQGKPAAAAAAAAPPAKRERSENSPRRPPRNGPLPATYASNLNTARHVGDR